MFHEPAINSVVESLIKSVRRALEVSPKTQVLTEEQWRTFLPQVTCLINQRPLYPSSNGIWENPPIMPNDLLIGNNFPPPVPEEQSKVNPRDLVRSTEKRVQEFWHCWLKYFFLGDQAVCCKTESLLLISRKEITQIMFNGNFNLRITAKKYFILFKVRQPDRLNIIF